MSLRVIAVAAVALVRSAVAAEPGLVHAYEPGSTDYSARPSPAHDYVLHCAGCHKLDGSGSTRVPALKDVGRLLERRGGREYVLAVPGVAQAPLSDARLAELMNWLIGHFSDRSPATRFSAAEVAGARTLPLRDPKRARAALGSDD